MKRTSSFIDKMKDELSKDSEPFAKENNVQAVKRDYISSSCASSSNKRMKRCISPYSVAPVDCSCGLMCELCDTSRQNYINKLPDEILMMIFSQISKEHLRPCAVVCRRWRRICCDERLSLWRILRIGDTKDLTLSRLANAIQRGAVSLSLTRESFIRDPDSWDNIFPVGYKSKLGCMDLSKLTISDEGLALILQCTHCLSRLYLDYCSLDQECCNAIACNRRLTFLNLSHCSLTGDGLKTILENCRSLRILNLYYTELDTEALDAVIPYLPSTLSILNIGGMKGLLDRHLAEIADNCPNLVTLDISNNFLLSLSSMDAIYGLRYMKYFFYTKREGFPT